MLATRVDGLSNGPSPQFSGRGVRAGGSSRQFRSASKRKYDLRWNSFRDNREKYLVFYKSLLSHHHSYHSEIIRISRTILISQNLFVDTQDEFPRARRRFRRARLRPLDEAKRRIQSDAVSRLHAAAADTRAHAFAGEEPANIQA